MQPDLHTVKDAAQGRWPGILAAIGIPAQSLRNRHQPCPCCGGRDRFRFDDKDGRGTFYCSHWPGESGDGFHLVMHFLGCGLHEAVQAVTAALGMGGGLPESRTAVKPPKTRTDGDRDRLARLVSIWESSAVLRDSDPVTAYLQGRGLVLGDALPDNIRFHAELPYWVQTAAGKPHCIGRFPAMVAAIRNSGGELQGLHCTYLQANYAKDGSHIPAFNKLAARHPETGEALPAKKMQSRRSGSLKGCAVPLWPHEGRLLVCEGIETALAACALFGWPVWACLSAHGLQALALPEGVKELLIVADHDEPRPVGYLAAHALAVRAIKQGIKTRIWQPEYPGDALDELHRRHRPAHAVLQRLQAT